MKEIDFIERILKDLSVFLIDTYSERSGIEVSSKRDPNDLLTEVDLAVQDRIVEALAREYPGDAIAAEERDLSRNPDDPNGRCWVIDPIDGTQNLVRSLFPLFGISIALAQGGRPVAGGVIMPMTRDLFLAARGEGAYRNGARLCVSNVDAIDVCRLEIDFSGPAERLDTLSRARQIIERAGNVRCHGAAVVGLCSVATGDADAFFHISLSPHDYAASQIIVEEAGGVCTRLDGSPLLLFDNRQGVLASNGHIHRNLVSLISGHDQS